MIYGGLIYVYIEATDHLLCFISLCCWGGHDRFDGRLAGPSSINYRNANVNVLFLFFFFFYYSIISYCVVAIRYFCLHISTTPEFIRQSLSLSPRGNFEANNNRPLPIHFPFCCCCIAHTERIGYGYVRMCQSLSEIIVPYPSFHRYSHNSFHAAYSVHVSFDSSTCDTAANISTRLRAIAILQLSKQSCPKVCKEPNKGRRSPK